jgi:hypothetical protein
MEPMILRLGYDIQFDIPSPSTSIVRRVFISRFSFDNLKVSPHTDE